MRNLIQYAAAIVAFGARLNYDTLAGELNVAEYPNREGAKDILDNALKDIELFEDTANYYDGLSIIALSDFIDGKSNPVTKTSRANILSQIDIVREGKFVQQFLERAKVNRSWHISETPSSCSYFGDLCTHRGISDTSHRRGRKSEREPEEYHLLSSKGVGREQLVTPAVELLYDTIPGDNLISENKNKPKIIIQNIESMKPEDLRDLIAKLEKEIKTRA